MDLAMSPVNSNGSNGSWNCFWKLYSSQKQNLGEFVVASKFEKKHETVIKKAMDYHKNSTWIVTKHKRSINYKIISLKTEAMPSRLRTSFEQRVLLLGHLLLGHHRFCKNTSRKKYLADEREVVWATKHVIHDMNLSHINYHKMR